MILPQAYSEGARIVAERLRTRIEEIEIQGFGNITASIGIATFPSDAAARSELISAADAALYSAKRTGRNRVCVFDASSDARELIASGEVQAEAEHTM